MKQKKSRYIFSPQNQAQWGETAEEVERLSFLL